MQRAEFPQLARQVRELVLEEAERRKIAPEQDQIDEVLAGYEKRYTNSPQWQQNRELLLPGLTKQLAEQSLIAQDLRTMEAMRKQLYTLLNMFSAHVL